MDNKESAVITFRVTPEELQTIENSAAKAGVTRADFVRAKALALDNTTSVQALEKKLDALCDRLGQQVKEADKPQEKPKCRNPEHAQLFGCGHCFICDVNIYVPGRP